MSFVLLAKTKSMRSLVSLVLIFFPLSSCNPDEITQGDVSMEPSVRRGEKLKIDSSPSALRNLRRFDMVLFESPDDPDVKWIYRIIGLPGEVVGFNNNQVIVDGRAIILPNYLRSVSYEPPIDNLDGFFERMGLRQISLPYAVEQNEYFVLGDNQKEALDSRYWGGLKKSSIIGKVYR
jgi:signal peptidase I